MNVSEGEMFVLFKPKVFNLFKPNVSEGGVFNLFKPAGTKVPAPKVPVGPWAPGPWSQPARTN